MDENEDEEMDTGVQVQNNLLRDLIMTLQRQNRPRSNEELLQKFTDGGVLTQARIRSAFEAVPRAEFVTADMRDRAYSDEPIHCEDLGFNVSAPHMHCLCLEKLDVREGHTVLDIGSGCGVLTALLAYLAGPSGSVRGVDVSEPILRFGEENEARWRRESQAYASHAAPVRFTRENGLLLADLEGLGGYDRVCVGASCPPRLLPSLDMLLKDGGKLITPSGTALLLIEKHGGQTTTTTLTRVMFGDLICPTDGEIILTKMAVAAREKESIVIPESTMTSDVSRANAEETAKDFSSLSDADKDVALVMENGEKLMAHRGVLIARCPFFEAVACSGMRDMHSNEYHIPGNLSLEAVRAVVQYIYTDDADVTAANAREIAEAATYFQLDRLVAMAEKCLASTIATDTVVNVLRIAVELGCEHLRQQAISFVVARFDEVAADPSFLTLEPEILVEVTAEACHQVTWMRQSLASLNLKNRPAP